MIFYLFRRARAIFQDSMRAGRCPHKLSASCSFGVFVAFSPYVGLHTLMVFLFSWPLGLNAMVAFIVLSLINNPWTMVPLYAADYFFGDFVLKWGFGINAMNFNPQWVSLLNEYITHYTGLSGVSLWAFMLGGNLLGLFFGVILYPVFLYFFKRIDKRSVA